jgi:hypothetical protein
MTVPGVDLSEQVTAMLYKSAEHNLQEQRRSLDELRTRTGALLSASSISNAFLGAVAARGSGAFHLPPRFWWALTPFALSLFACIVILWYSRGWKFSLRADVVEKLIPPAMPVNQIYAVLANKLESMIDSNEDKLQWRSRIFGGAAFALIFSVVAWLVLID